MLDVLVQQIVGVGQREQAAVELGDFGAVAAEGLGGHRLDDRHRILEPMRHLAREQLLVLRLLHGELERDRLPALLGQAVHLRCGEDHAGQREVAEEEIAAARGHFEAAVGIEQIIPAQEAANQHGRNPADEPGRDGDQADGDDHQREGQDVRWQRQGEAEEHGGLRGKHADRHLKDEAAEACPGGRTPRHELVVRPGDAGEWRTVARGCLFDRLHGGDDA